MSTHERIIASIRAEGPGTSEDLATRLDTTVTVVGAALGWLSKSEGGVVVLGRITNRGGHARKVWGLPGQSFIKPPSLPRGPGLAAKIKDWLYEIDRAAYPKEIAAALKVKIEPVRAALKRLEDRNEALKRDDGRWV